jgi:steroid Delta-isomerase
MDGIDPGAPDPRAGDGYDPHPARDAARASMAAVEAGDREAWLGLFAPDAIVEDPIGASMFDPEGRGHRGATAIATFYDTVIASGLITFTIRESYAGGRECANVGTITTTLPDGTRAIVDGVYTYRVDEQGRIAALRAYWEPDHLRLEPPAS